MKLNVTLVKSPISSIPNHIKIVEALGLHKLHQTKVHDDNPCIRGMIFKVKHLVRVEEVATKAKKTKETKETPEKEAEA